ncbi:PAS domain S-box protein [Methanolobus bombayensis]|uniref:PAS domain S-box protein n=1 Tax=Methanolobus bombayensis TaxID=38023 RepID=UPI001AE67C80|nr:PAS domain S-box protein [Methanolobus bombayensis]MBP1909118.1 PAS domain S-box-containing protein [Methanolobus bombayensis]
MKSISNIKANKYLALKVALLYIFLASLWILASDTVLGWIITNPEMYILFQTYKGMFFVIATGSLLFLYLSPKIGELSKSRKDLLETDSLLKKRLDYELTTIECMRLLQQPDDIDKIIPGILEKVHQTVSNSRTYVFRNENDPEIGLCMSQIYEEVSEGIEAQIDNPELQHLPYSEGAPTLLSVLLSGDNFPHIVEELEEPERSILKEQGIFSVLIIPIFTGEKLWGFIGFDDCDKERRWHEDDVNLLRVVADGIGEAILREESENKLIESEEKQAAMIANISDVIAIADRNAVIRYKSANVEKWFGWKPDELINRDMFDNIHPDDRGIAKDLFMSVLEKSGETVFSNIRYRCKNSTYKWIEVIGINLFDDPVINGILFNYHDITEKKKAEDALLESEKKFRTYIENAPYGIFIVDENETFLEVNETACILTGYSAEELIGMNMFSRVAPESRDEAIQGYHELMKKGFANVELRITRRDETEFWMRVDAAKLSDTRFIMFASDITERKNAEYSLIEAKMLAEENSRIKSEFLANMSHELRTPLTAIIGFSDVLNDELFGELNDKQKRHVQHINNGGRHLLELINDILDLSKIEAGKMELNRELFNVNEILEDIKSSVQPLAAKKKIDFEINNNIKVQEISADKLKFKQIMLNLLSNAIKFTPNYGKVLVNATKKDNDITVYVSDTGIGITKKMQENIFSPFTQVDSSNKRKYGGTGLGLALVKQFVEMHEGKIWVESEEGKGSTFTFTIKT